jgi:hypothetical protein
MRSEHTQHRRNSNLFIVYGLPRSRTFWLSRFLSYGDWNCGHDELRHLRSMDDVKSWFSQPNTGTVETGAAPWWRLAPSGIKTVTIRRNPADVIESLVRIGFDRARVSELVRRLDAKLDQIEARVPGVLSVRYEDLDSEETCARIFEHCLPYRHDPRWFAIMAPMKLQINMPALMRYCIAHKPQLDKLAAQAKWRIIDSFARKPERDRDDGITIKEEPFANAWRDSQKLATAHLVYTDQVPDPYIKNVELMQKYADMGQLQVITARCNGRIFGYQMAVIAPSMDAPGQVDAMHLSIFADASFPGLGMRLQRASIAALREKGVDELFMRAGIRGDGSRLGSAYRRLGATEYGQLYSLSLKD